MRKHQLGVTLLEILLALAIGAAVILMGIQQYRQYQTQQSLAQLQFNVDQLFQGLSFYYVNYCSSLSTSSTTYPLNVHTDLEVPGYLSTHWQSYNPLINNTDTANNYIVQFNISTGTPPNRYENACWNFTGKASDLTCTTPQATQASVYLWRAQVAIEFPSTANMTALKNLLVADCISDLSGSAVTPCDSSPPATGHYLVWERLPSFATSSSSSGLWTSIPVLQEFNLQYTHDQMYEFQNSTYSSSQNYMCPNG
ncbi:MAG: prepilin-type N-terminal cleavage/methylation domain-containing protein [Gammaproteobacteria bacterium]